MTKQDVMDNGLTHSIEFYSRVFSYAHPSISHDGKRLFFSSNMEGTQGRSDIYFVNLLPDEHYSSPINAGYNINTSDSENYPYHAQRGLYFSSSRLGGFEFGYLPTT